MKIAVIAGTPVDTQMGVELLKSRGAEALGFPISRTPEEQTAFQVGSQSAREAVTARQIAALGREYGLDIAQVDPALAQALTPRDALSLRSSVPLLEGALTPLFLSRAPLGGRPLRLEGTPERMTLVPM